MTPPIKELDPPAVRFEWRKMAPARLKESQSVSAPVRPASASASETGPAVFVLTGATFQFDGIERLIWEMHDTLAQTLGTDWALMAYEGFDQVIRTLPRIAERVPDARYVVVCGGSALQPLARLAADLEVSDRLELRGPLHDDEIFGMWSRTPECSCSCTG